MIAEMVQYMNGHPILILVLLTLVPALELRASIPWGILKTDLHWTMVFIVCVITNMILGPVIYFIIDNFIHMVLRVKYLDRLYEKFVERTQRKIHKPVEKYGEMGIAAFIGVPLPGSGSYTGAFGAYLLGLGMRKFIIANVIGVLIAGIIVTVISLTGGGVFRFLIKAV